MNKLDEFLKKMQRLEVEYNQLACKLNPTNDEQIRLTKNIKEQRKLVGVSTGDALTLSNLIVLIAKVVKVINGS